MSDSQEPDDPLDLDEELRLLLAEETSRRTLTMPDRPRLPRLLSQASAKALLESHDWTSTIGGKHVVKMEKPGHRPITLPAHKGATYSVGLTAAILRQAGLKGEPRGDERDT